MNFDKMSGLQKLAEKAAYERLCLLNNTDVVNEVLTKITLPLVDMVYTDPSDPTHIELIANQGTLPSRLERHPVWDAISPFSRLFAQGNGGVADELA